MAAREDLLASPVPWTLSPGKRAGLKEHTVAGCRGPLICQPRGDTWLEERSHGIVEF